MISSFLLISAVEADTAMALVQRASEQLRKVFPDARLERVDIGVPWAQALFISPADEHQGELLSSVTANSFSALAYGELDDPAGGTPAKAIHQAMRTGADSGLAAVAGCFGGAIIDHAGRTVTLVSDGLGQRSMRYARLGGAWLATPHDLCLVAAGVAVEGNCLALASIARFGWSFGNASLLAQVQTVAAEEIVTLRDESVEARIHPSFGRAESVRSSGPNPAAIRESIIDSMIAYIRHNHDAHTPLEVELSAGFDSRAVLAIALAASHSDVVAFTDGPPDSQDMRTARRIAARMRVKHRGGGGGGATRSQRQRRFTRLAALTNGQATLMPLMTSGPTEWQDSPDVLGGDGLEAMRGYYYPKLRGSDDSVFDPPKIAGFVMSKFTAGAGLLGSAEEQQLRRHVEERIGRWTSICRTQSDAYDLLYLIERTGTWNQKLRRVPSRRRNPFYSRAATFSFLSLPGARGLRAGVHEELFRRYLAPTLVIPLNGETLPLLLVGGPIGQELSRLTTLAAKAFWKVGDRIIGGRAGSGAGDLEELRRQNFCEHLAQDWRPLLTSEQSVTRALIGEAQVGSLIAAATGGSRGASEILANMLVAEEFFRLVKCVNASSNGNRREVPKAVLP